MTWGQAGGERRLIQKGKRSVTRLDTNGRNSRTRSTSDRQNGRRCSNQLVVVEVAVAAAIVRTVVGSNTSNSGGKTSSRHTLHP